MNNKYVKNYNKKVQHKRNEDIKNNKGNWEFSFYQKIYDSTKESNIKHKLNSLNNFNPKLVDQYMNTYEKKEIIIENKINNNKKITKTEQYIYDNYNNKNKRLIEDDYEEIKKLDIYAKPKTNEGRGKLLLLVLQYEIKKNDNDKNICSIYYKLQDDDVTITDELRNEYNEILTKLYEIINNIDIIKIQMTQLYYQMPPLNIKGFKKLDTWQVNVIKNINNNISTFINAPTSSGKSILSGYTITKGITLFVLPTDALVWQIAAYITKSIDGPMSILTETYKSKSGRDDMIELLNISEAIVGTPNIIMDYLPYIKIKFNWLVFDEIHKLGDKDGYAIEYIIKCFNTTPFLALSATINNIDEYIDYFKNITSTNVDKIICNKRFFNLQKYYYSNKKINKIHPFALIDSDMIINKKLTYSLLQPTPNDVWELSNSLNEEFDLQELKMSIYFKDIRIKLNDVDEYFEKLLYYIYNIYSSEKDKIDKILNKYKNVDLENDNKKINIVDFTFELKKTNNVPAIIFNNDTDECLLMIKNYSIQIDKMEREEYPNLYKERFDENKNMKKLENKNKSKDNTGNNAKDKINDKKEMKQLLGNVTMKKDTYNNQHIINNVNDTIEYISLNEPHENYILNNTQIFNESLITEWSNLLKQYFKPCGDSFHFIIKLLWRGIGVYVCGLPEPYLRLVQTLACQKQLNIVFSDHSLVYGISMPFKTVAIINKNLDNTIFHQMCGRAGRRGLDKEGNIIFLNFDINEIKKYTMNKSNNITYHNSDIYTIKHFNELSKIYKSNINGENLIKNYFTKDEDVILKKNNFYKNIYKNYETKWNFAYINNNNHLDLNWKLRYSNECIIITILLPYIKKYFQNKNFDHENNQIEMAYFLSNFITIKYTDDHCKILKKTSMMLEEPYCTIKDNIKNIDIIINDNIDNNIYLCIQNNKLSNELYHYREQLITFGYKIQIIQHYYYHIKENNICKLMGKLLTRIWWIYHTSSHIYK